MSENYDLKFESRFRVKLQFETDSGLKFQFKVRRCIGNA